MPRILASGMAARRGAVHPMAPKQSYARKGAVEGSQCVGAATGIRSLTDSTAPLRARLCSPRMKFQTSLARPRFKSNAGPVPNADSELRIAWVTPSLARGYFMQPLFREFTKRFPGTVVFTGVWPGFVAACRDTFRVRELIGVGFRSSSKPSSGNPRGVITASPRVLVELWKFCPHLVFVRGFDLCTIYAILLKVWTRCSLVLLWGGVGPHVSFLDSPARLALRRVTARWFDYARESHKRGS